MLRLSKEIIIGHVDALTIRWHPCRQDFCISMACAFIEVIKKAQGNCARLTDDWSPRLAYYRRFLMPSPGIKCNAHLNYNSSGVAFDFRLAFVMEMVLSPIRRGTVWVTGTFTSNATGAGATGAGAGAAGRGSGWTAPPFLQNGASLSISAIARVVFVKVTGERYDAWWGGTDLVFKTKSLSLPESDIQKNLKKGDSDIIKSSRSPSPTPHISDVLELRGLLFLIGRRGALSSAMDTFVVFNALGPSFVK